MLFAIAISASLRAEAAKVISVGALDKDYLVVQISAGDVALETCGEEVRGCVPEPSMTVVTQTSTWLITSDQNANYSAAGKSPMASSRKVRVSGHSWGDWVAGGHVGNVCACSCDEFRDSTGRGYLAWAAMASNSLSPAGDLASRNLPCSSNSTVAPG